MFGLSLPARLAAQPSGGPYGPLDLTYEVPESARSVYYVAPDGNARARGNSPDAPTTLEAAIPKAQTGDAIILRGGVYRTGSLVLNQGVTIQPYKNEKPILKGTEVADQWEQQPNGLWITKWTKLFPQKPAAWWRRESSGRSTPMHWFNNDMVFLDGRLLKSAGWEGEVDEDSYYIDYDTQTVYLGADPTGHLVEITAHDVAIWRVIEDVHGRKNDRKGYTLRGITFTQYAYRALEIEGTEPDGPADPSTYGKDVVGTVIEHCTITYCSRVAGYFRGDNMIIRHCLVSDTETEGIYVLSSGNLLLERNIIRRNNMQNMKGYFPSAVKIFNQSHDAVVRENLVMDLPHSSGVWFDVGNRNARFYNNWVINATDGFWMEISSGAIAAGNVFVDCEKGIRALNAADVHCYHNTFVNSMASFERNTRSAVNDHFGWHPATGPDVDERDGHIFVNNLMVAGNDYRRVLLNTEQAPALCGQLSDPQVERVNNNVYIVRNTANSPLIHWAPVNGDKCQADYPTIAEIQKLGVDEKSREYLDYHLAIFQSEELGRFNLLPGAPGVTGAGDVPREVLNLLGWDDPVEFVGAFPPLE